MNCNERTEPLGGGISIITSDNHSFGADAVLLADFSLSGVIIKTGIRLCDLGTGCGIIPLLWRIKTDKELAVTGVEIQPEAAEIARRNAAPFAPSFSIVEADLRELDSSFNGLYDLVTCNPPYKQTGTGALSCEDAARTARHEVSCTLEDTVTAGARLLRHGGRLCLCHRPERIADLCVLMRAHGVEPKRMRLVQQRIDKRPWLILIEGKKGAKPGLITEHTLIVEENGRISKEMQRMYGKEFYKDK